MIRSSPPNADPTCTIIVSTRNRRRNRHARRHGAAAPRGACWWDSRPRRARPLGCVDDFRVDWQWIPAWRPADITEGGREQLRAIGFTI
jgi:hypothetical protein